MNFESPMAVIGPFGFITFVLILSKIGILK